MLRGIHVSCECRLKVAVGFLVTEEDLNGILAPFPKFFGIVDCNRNLHHLLHHVLVEHITEALFFNFR